MADLHERYPGQSADVREHDLRKEAHEAFDAGDYARAGHVRLGRAGAGTFPPR